MASDPTQPSLPEQIVRIDDPDSGLEGVIVLHSTRLGPAAGGCRFWSYPDAAAMTRDALRLAEGMSYKNALAGLPLGGGKAVIRAPQGAFDRAALFRAFGKAVAGLGGRYLTAEDVGTSVADMVQVARSTRHVAGLPPQPGASGGDPSPWTAKGVFRAMGVAVERKLGRDLAGVTVAVQGLGNVGLSLCGLLHHAGARLVVAEPRRDVAQQAADLFGARVVGLDEIVGVKADVFAPCALGGAIDAAAVERLRAAIVCGAANNQLAGAEQGAALAARGILYAPDYLVNAGGIINVAAEYFGWAEAEVRTRVDAIGLRLAQVLDNADRDGLPPSEAADALARAIIARGPVEAVTAEPA